MTWDLARRIAISTAGVLVILIGIPLWPLPGPGTLVVLAGFGLIASQWPWGKRLWFRVRRWLVGARRWMRDRRDRWRARRASTEVE